MIRRQPQTGDAGGIDGQRSIHPTAQGAVLAIIEIMTAGEDGDAGFGTDGQVKNKIGQPAAGMGRDDQIVGAEGNLLDDGFDKSDLSEQARPVFQIDATNPPYP